MRKKLIIAIDGPSGSGKSTTGKLLAQKLNYFYLDTGAMYRAVTLFALREGISYQDLNKLIPLTESLNFQFIKNGDEILVNGINVSKEIRTPEVSAQVSNYSTVPEIRKILVKKQKELGSDGGVVMEGRDITTVVFPDADLKIFLTADIDTRTERRFLELNAKGIGLDKQMVKENLMTRDKIDSSREVSPLTKSDDSILIDTTSMTIEEQVDLIFNKAMEILESSR
ncbi:MAG: (d)CMP kinase [Ignavibacteria bacterium]|nr:(d)CMP kinase [Ignavibacteria bacterium]